MYKKKYKLILSCLETVIKNYLSFVFLIALVFPLTAQDPIPKLKDQSSLQLLIPPIDVLVEAAWKQHDLIKMRAKQVDVKKENLLAKKRNWTRGITARANYAYGNIFNISENVVDGSTANLATNNTQLNYSVGFFLNFPLYEFYNRKSQMRQAKVEIDMARDFLEFQKFEVKETVIRRYEDLLLKQDLLEVAVKNLVNWQLSQAQAEKEYRRGLIPIHEYSRLSDIAATKEGVYLNAKSDFLLAKKLLENITGLTFN